MAVQAKKNIASVKQYLTLQPNKEPQQKMGFTFNPHLVAIISVVFAFLYFSFEQHRVKFFVYFSLIINFLHPFLVKMLRKDTSLKMLLIYGTFLHSLLFDIWTLCYPHKVYVYYIPQLLGLTIKMIDLIVQFEWRTEITQELCKFQSKIELLVVLFCFVGTITKMKWVWSKLIKCFALLFIFKLKYTRHYGSQLALNEIHFSLDYLSKTLLLRQHYQQIYAKICLLGNPFIDHQEILL